MTQQVLQKSNVYFTNYNSAKKMLLCRPLCIDESNKISKATNSAKIPMCFSLSLAEHNKKERGYVRLAVTSNTCAHFHCLARDNEVLAAQLLWPLFRRSFPVFAVFLLLHHFFSSPQIQTKNAFMTTLSLLLHVTVPPKTWALCLKITLEI